MNRKARGSSFALVIILSLISLATVLVLAFFSRASTELAVSAGSAGSEASLILAATALESVISDLREEIIAGSKPPAALDYPVFIPKTAANAMPTRRGSAPDLRNLIKRSASGFEESSLRASSISTGTASINGRYISNRSWNATRLLPMLSATVATPPASFVEPDWVYLTRDGSNCTALDPVHKSNGSNPILGRFAYLIYDEGGLLDINAAGFPAGITLAEVAKNKGSLAMADLVKTGLTDLQVQKLITWRNPSTAGNPGEFIKKLKLDPSAGNGVPEGGRGFVSRKQLLNFFAQNNLNPKALQFLGTFSRGLNQPSFGVIGPALPASPAPFPIQLPNGGYSLPQYSGNNDADSNSQRQLNPCILDVRVATPFPRFIPFPADRANVIAKVNEPLVLKRFPLNRLAWLTYKGPVAPGGILLNDPALLKPLRDAGLSDDFLKLGTEANIKAAFGLSWSNDPAGSSRKVWVYDHSNSPALIASLSEIAAAGRDPDFLELLKASISIGSLGKAAASDLSSGAWNHAHDIRIDFQLLHIFANIIDQFDCDGFPTEIALPASRPDSTLLGIFERKVRGIENLPYIHGVRSGGAIVVRQSNPPVPPGAVPNEPLTTAIPVTDPGMGALLFHHWLWNPHSSVSGSTSAGPAEFRVITAMGDPLHSSANPVSNLRVTHTPWGSPVIPSGPLVPMEAWGIPAKYQFPSASGTTSGARSFPLSQSGTELLFQNSAGAFKQPTALVFPGIPAATNLRTGPGHQIRSIPEGTTGSLANPIDGNRNYIGVLIGTFPLRASLSVAGMTYLQSAAYVEGSFIHDQLPGQNGVVTSFLQYKASSDWITYDFKSALLAGCNAWIDPGSAPFDPVQPGNMSANGGSRTALWIDPRTSRFGAPWQPLPPTSGSGIARLNLADASLMTVRPSTGNGAAFSRNVPSRSAGGYLGAIGWNANTPATDYVGNDVGTFFPQFLAENLATNPNSYRDPDGVTRGGMARYSPPGILPGKPLATNNDASRPVILNRPFRSVAELGYVFRDQPWKQLDFFTAESGDAALLDAFCLNEDSNPDPLVSGKVNLNTHNPEVLKAILSGVNREPEGASQLLSATEVTDLANGFCNWIHSLDPGSGPLSSPGELLGRYAGGTTYESFWASNPVPFAGGTTSNANILQRYRETPLRAMADVGEVRVWTLLIDLVAQAGFCGPGASNLGQFVMRGEARWWIHLAIDRATGRVVAIQREIINQ